MIHPDYIIVGAGLSGSVMAERLAEDLDKKVFIIEQRGYLGGNCSDYTNKDGVLCHRFGSHVFHTDDEGVWEYLSRFTDWHNPYLRFNVKIGHRFVPLPFNLNSLHQTHSGRDALFLESDLIEEYGEDSTVSLFELMDNPKFKDLADYIYHNIFEGYNQKMWDMKPEELLPEVVERLPIRISRNSQYFTDRYQGVPRDGYTQMFTEMLSHPNIDILLNTDYKRVLHTQEGQLYFNGKPYKGRVVFTGCVDEWFDYCYGELPYRTIDFQHQTVKGVNFIHPVGVTSYPSDYSFIRVCEFKHITGQECNNTTLSYEYPHPYRRGGGLEPLYPVPTDRSKEIYERYSQLIRNERNVVFLGRLGEYRYLNMDTAVRRALDKYEEIKKGE